MSRKGRPTRSLFRHFPYRVWGCDRGERNSRGRGNTTHPNPVTSAVKRYPQLSLKILNLNDAQGAEPNHPIPSRTIWFISEHSFSFVSPLGACENSPLDVVRELADTAKTMGIRNPVNIFAWPPNTYCSSMDLIAESFCPK